LDLSERSGGDVAGVLRDGSARRHALSNYSVTPVRPDSSDVNTTKALNPSIDFPRPHKIKFND